MPYVPILQWTGSNPGSPGPPQVYATGAFQMIPSIEGAPGQGAAVFSFGGALYQVLQIYVSVTTAPFLQPIQVFRSLDAGATWTILDAGNSPLRKFQSIGVGNGIYSGGVWYNGGSTVTVAYLPLSSVITLRDFDLTSGTWGANYGAGSPVIPAVNQLFKRSNGDWVVIGPTAWVWPSNPTGLRAYVLSGGVWSSFDLDSNVSAGYHSTSGNAATIDSADTLHVFERTMNAGFTAAQVLYQQFKADNSLGTFKNFLPTDFGIKQIGAFGQTGNPVIVAGKILWGVLDATRAHPTILIGSNLTAPVWTVLGGDGIDPGFTPAFQNGNTPILATDGTTIWGTYVFDDYLTNIATTVRLCQTCNVADPTLGWSGTEIYADLAENWNENGQSPTLSGINQFPMVTIQTAIDNTTSVLTNWFFIPPANSKSVCAAPVPPAAVKDTIIQLIGWKLYPNVPCEDALPGLELPPVKRAV